MWGDDSSDESSSDDEVPAIGYTAAYFLKRFVGFVGLSLRLIIYAKSSSMENDESLNLRSIQSVAPHNRKYK